MHWQSDIVVLTPLFNRGAYQDTPEIRVPSIRGMVRWWFRALGGTPDEEKQVFGGVHGKAVASRLVFRVRNPSTQPATTVPTLPHKQGGQAGPQAAFPAGVRFTLEVLSRCESLPDVVLKKLEAALEVWLLLGSLGLRANRAGGNVWPADGTAPRTPGAMRSRLDALGCLWPVLIAGLEAGTTVEQLRAAATDTVNGAAWVFGYARGRQRLASALKFKIGRFDQDLRLLVFAADQRVLDEAKNALRGHRSRPETWSPIRPGG